MDIDNIMGDELRQHSVGKTIKLLYMSVNENITEIHRLITESEFETAIGLTDNLKTDIMVLSAILEQIEQSREV
jgi:hypothetical protein